MDCCLSNAELVGVFRDADTNQDGAIDASVSCSVGGILVRTLIRFIVAASVTTAACVTSLQSCAHNMAPPMRIVNQELRELMAKVGENITQVIDCCLGT